MLISTADQPAIRLAEAGRYTLNLGPDGSLHGIADCQPFTGAFDVEGSQLQLTMTPADSTGCASGSYAAQYIRLLKQVATYTLDGRGLILHLRSAGGTMVFLPIA
jgi:heat shock protein HslJ